MFRKVLIANRGEIAARVIRAGRELGIETVAVYSEADRNALHVRLADEAYLLGPTVARESYLNIPRIVEVARRAGAEAIHPGYGFLAENAAFVEACQAAGIIFVGPPASAQRLAGEKTAARRVASKAGVPIIPGTLEPVATEAEATRIAAKIGYPIFLKAAAGGGGKGMRLVQRPADLPGAIRGAASEAGSAFADTKLYLERQIAPARHVEIQILADAHGNVVHLGERECSIQRRHQKLIEESPSTALDPELRRQMGEAAVRVAQAVGYVNAGTVEFLLDAERRFYFMEVNSRLQVEHPVTELVTGIDLVQAQLRIAAGEPLWLGQDDIRFDGAAIECRINAEDPLNNFLPSTGRILALREPNGLGVRVESALYAGMDVTIDYDPMVAKLIVWAPSRDAAIGRMARALRELAIVGVRTTTPFHFFVLANPAFQNGELDTGFVERHWRGQVPGDDVLAEVAALFAAIAAETRPAASPASTASAPAPVGAGSSWKLAGRPGR